VHAAAELPPTGSGTLPGLSQLDLCHEHTLQIAVRIVGRLGPEPRAIPDLHMLLNSHRRRLRHLIARDRPHVNELGRAVVAACDADHPLPQPQRDLVDASDPAPHRCTVCAAAASDTRLLLTKTAGQLTGSTQRHHQLADLSLCRAHLRNLIDHAQDQDLIDDPTLLAAIAQVQLTQLIPALEWLDSGFGHPHTIRHTLAELTAPRSCPPARPMPRDSDTR
jgi:hypothetical protein